MDLSGNTVLITGGATGIGLAIARRFLAAGSTVIACGRRAEVLEEASRANPGLVTRIADVSSEQGRVELASGMMRDYPALNVLVNNAGVQRRDPVIAPPAAWSERREEIAINLEAPIHLTTLLLPQLQPQPRAAVINVGSGLAFVPAAFCAVYSATKAALHSYTLSLRHALAGTSVQVIEIIPPSTNTDLGGVGLHDNGVNVDVFADDVMSKIAAGDLEVAHGFSEVSRKASRDDLDRAFERLNGKR